MSGTIFFVLVTMFLSTFASAFLVSSHSISRALTADTASAVHTTLCMIGGRGWDNNDYLSSLSGDDEDRIKSQEDYKDFSDRRAAFNARQEEIMKTPQGQAFIKQRQEQQYRNLQQEEPDNSITEDGILFGDLSEGSGGGTRMAQMMAQANRLQGQRSPSNMIGGFNQQLLGPLDDSDNEEELENRH